MTGQELSRTSLAAALGFAAMVATGQTAGPAQRAEWRDIPHGRPTVSSTTQNFTGARPEVPAAANVLEDVPRETGGTQPPATCETSTVVGEIPAQCRRWSQIAGTFQN